MVKAVILCSLICFSTMVQAGPIDDWFEEVVLNFQPEKVAVLSDKGKRNNLPGFVATKGADLTALKVLASDVVQANYLVNGFVAGKGYPDPESDAMWEILAKMAIGFVVNPDRSVVRDLKSKEPDSRKATNGFNPLSGKDWANLLGYEGQVIGRKGKFLVVVAFPGHLKGKVQGVTVNPGNLRDPKGDSIIQLVKQQGDFGLFKAVMEEEEGKSGSVGSFVKFPD